MRIFSVLVCLILLTGCVTKSALEEAIQKSEAAQNLKLQEYATAQDRKIADLSGRLGGVQSSIETLTVSLESLNSFQRKRRLSIKKMITSLEDQANALREELSGI